RSKPAMRKPGAGCRRCARCSRHLPAGPREYDSKAQANQGRQGGNMSIQNGRVIVVIGAGSKGGIAYACAHTLAEQGAKVAIADLNAAKLPELAGALPGGAAHS